MQWALRWYKNFIVKLFAWRRYKPYFSRSFKKCILIFDIHPHPSVTSTNAPCFLLKFSTNLRLLWLFLQSSTKRLILRCWDVHTLAKSTENLSYDFDSNLQYKCTVTMLVKLRIAPTKSVVDGSKAEKSNVSSFNVERFLKRSMHWNTLSTRDRFFCKNNNFNITNEWTDARFFSIVATSSTSMQSKVNSFRLCRWDNALIPSTL